MRRSLGTLAIASAVLAGNAGALGGQDDPGYVTGPWHYLSISCVDTTVRSVEPRLVGGDQTTFTAADFKESGVHVTFDTHLGMQRVAPHVLASVTHYQGTIGNNIMAAERRGDRVQVCFLGGPAPTEYCDPDKDIRGRSYRVWDYRQRARYLGFECRTRVWWRVVPAA